MPERFLGDWPRDAFIPFSLGITLIHCNAMITTKKHFSGARACLGRRCEPSLYLKVVHSRAIF
jgi:hypothetical protein